MWEMVMKVYFDMKIDKEWMILEWEKDGDEWVWRERKNEWRRRWIEVIIPKAGLPVESVD